MTQHIQIVRTVADKVLRDKASNIAKDSKYDGYKRGLASMDYKFFDKKSATLADKSTKGSGVNIKSAPQNQKEKVHSAFKGNIWGADLADMQLISRYNKGIRFLFCVIDIFSKYAWVIPLKDQKGVSIIAVFQSIFKQSNRKPNKIWVVKGSEFYNTSFIK